MLQQQFNYKVHETLFSRSSGVFEVESEVITAH